MWKDVNRFMGRQILKEIHFHVDNFEISTRHGDPFDCDLCGENIPLGHPALMTYYSESGHRYWICVKCVEFFDSSNNEGTYKKMEKKFESIGGEKSLTPKNLLHHVNEDIHQVRCLFVVGITHEGDTMVWSSNKYEHDIFKGAAALQDLSLKVLNGNVIPVEDLD